MQMIVDMTKVINGTTSTTSFSFNNTIPKEELKGTELLELKNLKVTGFISRPSDEIFDLKMQISGTMVLPCAITLKPVDYNFETEIDDDLSILLEEIGKKMENMLDIFPIVWENVLMEMPSKVVSPDAKDYHIEGDGWKLITDEDNDEGNNALSSLKDLLEKKV